MNKTAYGSSSLHKNHTLSSMAYTKFSLIDRVIIHGQSRAVCSLIAIIYKLESLKYMYAQAGCRLNIENLLTAHRQTKSVKIEVVS